MRKSTGRLLSQFKLISFDVTGTLIRLRKAPGLIYAQVAKEAGYTGLNIGELNAGFKRNYKSLNSSLPNYGQNQGMHWREWWTMLVKQTFKDTTEIAPPHLSIIAEKLIDFYETNEAWVATEDAVELVRYVKEDMGLCVGVITNSDPRTSVILKNLHFPEFDFVLSAFDATKTKPDPKIFEIALKSRNIEPRYSLHVGNDPILDYEAAKSCSWTGVLIDNTLTQDQPEVYKFQSLSTFLKHLQKDSIN